MARDVISAKLDIIFKKIFSEAENEDMLHDFLASLLEIPYNSIQKIEVLNSDVLPDVSDGKLSRMDLKLMVDNRLINVEMQVNNQADFKDRTLYYWSKLYTGSLKSGEKYNQLKQSIVINILNFNMFDCKNFHSHFKMMETERHEILSDKCSIHFFELKKINKKISENNRMELWLQFINAESEAELEMLENTNVPVIQKAVMVIHKMSEDEKMREIAYQREKALHDEASNISAAREKGIEFEREKMLAAMRESGLDDETINRILSRRGLQ